MSQLFKGTTGSGSPIDTITGDDGVIVPADGSNNINFTGETVANATNAKPLYIDGDIGTSTQNFEIQIGAAITGAPGDKLDAGIVSFDDTAFAVDADGYVTFAGSGAATTLTGDSGGALSPTANNFNIIGDGSTTVAGAVSTLTVQLTGLTNHSVLVGAGTTTITKVGPTATVGQVLQSAGASADPAFSTATYPLTTTINQVLFSSATNTVTGLATANNGVLTTGATGVPVITAIATDGQLIIGSTAGVPAASTLTAGTGIGIVNAGNSITISGTATVPLSFPTDSGTATPAANALTISGGTGINTSGSGAAVTVNLDSPVLVANGGTGSTSFTAGSVIFSNGTILTEDNSNLFWDDANNRLGINTSTPLDSIHVVDGVCIEHTAAEDDDHALELIIDASGFGDVKAVDIVYTTGAITSVQDEEAILVNIDESASTGGIMAGYLCLTTSEGSAVVNGYETGININPIVHSSGTFGNADNILNIAVDVTAALASGGAGSISIFVNDTETLTVGDAAQWGEFEIILSTGASGGGVAPIFSYSTGGAAFSAFSPADGTNGFRNSGAILWDASSLAGWATATSGEYEIRITRTRNVLSTTPIIEELQIAALTEFKWDKNGDVNLNSLTLVTPLVETSGGTGSGTYVTGDILYSDSANSLAKLPVGSNTEVLTLAGGIPSWAAPATAGTVTSVSGTVNRISSTGGSTPVIDIDAAYVGQASITTLGTITTGVWNGTTVTVPYGGTGATTLTGVLTGNGTSAVTANTITQHAPLIGGASNAVTDTGVMTNGQLMIGSTGVAPVISTLTAGTDITITEGAGSITIASTASGGGWVEETGTTRALAINENVVGNNAATITMTLPTTAAFGSKIRIAGKGAGSWKIAQNSSELIHFGTSTTTTGVGGSLESTEVNDAIELLCIVADTEWLVLSSIGNITIV